MNKILFQQIVLDSITFLAHYYQEISNQCWKEISKILVSEYSAEINQTKLFQYLKLVIRIMRNEQIENNRFFYTILIEDNINRVTESSKLLLEY